MTVTQKTLLISIFFCSVLVISELLFFFRKDNTETPANVPIPLPTDTLIERDLSIFPHSTLYPMDDPTIINKTLPTISGITVVYAQNTHSSQLDLPVFKKQAITYAKSTDTITITDCEFHPVSVKMPSSDILTIMNNDPLNHIIQVGNKSIAVEPQKKKSVHITNPKGSIIYYYCTSDPIHVGWLVF